MIIEFLGKPGSGKSTLNKLLKDTLKIDGYASIGFEEALKICLKDRKGISFFVEFIPLRYLRTFYALWSGKSIQHKFYQAQSSELVNTVKYLLDEIKMKCPGEYKNRKSWFEFKIRQYALFEQITNGANLIALSDEGLASSIGNLFIYNSRIADLSRIKSFLINWPLPDMLIAVQAETKSCVRRLKKRGFPEFLKNKQDADIVAGLENQELLDSIITEEANRRHTPVLCIENEYRSVEQLRSSNSFKSLVNEVATAVSTLDTSHLTKRISQGKK